MLYSELFHEFERAVPESVPFCNKMAEKYLLDDEDGMHVYFGFVVRPYVQKELENGNLNIIRKIAAFFEKMESDSDNEIGGVFEQSILETLLAEHYSLIRQYANIWGPETTKAIEVVGKFVS